jgi:predicted ester cyclase
MLTQTSTSFPDMQITADELIAEGNKVVVRWTYTATHQQEEVFGIPPRGKRVRVPGITVYRIAAGKIVEEIGVADALSLMVQLGAGPAPCQGES